MLKERKSNQNIAQTRKTKRKHQKSEKCFVFLILFLLFSILFIYFLNFCNFCDVLGFWSTKVFCLPKKAFCIPKSFCIPKVFCIPKQVFVSPKSFLHPKVSTTFAERGSPKKKKLYPHRVAANWFGSKWPLESLNISFQIEGLLQELIVAEALRGHSFLSTDDRKTLLPLWDTTTHHVGRISSGPVREHLRHGLVFLRRRLPQRAAGLEQPEIGGVVTARLACG